MNINNLKKILTILEEVRIKSFEFGNDIREGIDKIEVLSKKWMESYKQDRPEYYPLDLSSVDVWRTYGDCRKFTLSLEDGRLHCSVTVYEGDLLHGQPTRARFEAELVLPDEFLLKVAKVLESRFEDHLEGLYEDELEARKKKWMSDFGKQLLSD
jgi:hypothetical protein